MYFVHPQIKFNFENLKSLFFSFFQSPDEKKLEKLKLLFPQKQIIFTDMGRSAFKLIIEKLKLQNSQILFPAFICDIFFPIFKEYNLSPIFLDIEKKTFHIKIEEIKRKITSKTKAIFVCHTYGLPVDIEKIRTITNNQLLIIEDCAHSFGVKYPSIGSERKEMSVGNFGDVAFFSLYKQFPCQRGGMAIIKCQTKNNQYLTNLLKTSFSFRDFISLLNSFSFFAFLFKKLGRKIAPKIQKKEKSKKILGINNFSLNIFLHSFEDFEENLKKRVELALVFQKKLEDLGFELQEKERNVFCYLSALVPKDLDRDRFVKELWKRQIFATRIWKEPIILNQKIQKEYKINLTEFPNTVEVAKRIVNFPLQNFYTKKDIEKITLAIKKILSSCIGN